MDYVRRISLLRATALVAIAVSAVLTVDHVRPGRAFCPLAEACAAARESALGTIGGVPTSIIGLAAFGALLVLTLLPLEISRPVLKPVGALSAAAGLGFIAYQHLVLPSFCPLCLIADSAGFVAGVLTVTWPRLPTRPSGRTIRWESGASRTAWSMAAILAAVLPFAIPRAQEPGWVEITPLGEAAFAEPGVTPDREAPQAAEVRGTETASDLAPEVAASQVFASLPVPHAPAAPTPDKKAPAAPLGTPPTESASIAAVATPLSLPSTLPTASARPAPSALTAAMTPALTPAPAPSVKVAAPKPSPLMVVYLNAFCPHCRATHERLERVLAETGVRVRRRRVYTWAGKDVPAWARACAFAQKVGREERMFGELLHAKRNTTREILAAGRRAGLDVHRLAACLKRRDVPARLARDRALVKRAHIRRLPTIDVGRRRLMGAQSSKELRVALLAAVAAISG